MNNVWIVSEGSYYKDNIVIIAVFSSKDKATEFCRDMEFKWNTSQGLFLNKEKRIYRKIDGFIVDDKKFPSNWKYYNP